MHRYPSATNEIGIAFSPKVKVTTTDLLKPSLTGLLSKVMLDVKDMYAIRN